MRFLEKLERAFDAKIRNTPDKDDPMSEHYLVVTKAGKEVPIKPETMTEFYNQVKEVSEV